MVWVCMVGERGVMMNKMVLCVCEFYLNVGFSLSLD